MKKQSRRPKGANSKDRVVRCEACGERFNSPAEAEQHERNCLNRAGSGAVKEYNPKPG